MSYRAVALLLGLSIAGAAGASWLLRARSEPAGAAAIPRRVVSLAPSITETLFAIGAGDVLVGRSDYCDFPEAVRALPAVGTSLSPNVEAIARLQPDLILDLESLASGAELARLARTVRLPGLTLDEILDSTRRIGRIVGQPAAADALATRLDARLRVPAPAGPRLLVVFGMEKGRLQPLWFIKRNSVHGLGIHAAGARNAIDRDETGAPALSVEGLLRIDPDLMIVIAPVGATPAERDAWLAPFRALRDLRAAREGRLGFLAGSGLQKPGPRLLAYCDALAGEVARIRR